MLARFLAVCFAASLLTACSGSGEGGTGGASAEGGSPGTGGLGTGGTATGGNHATGGNSATGGNTATGGVTGTGGSTGGTPGTGGNKATGGAAGSGGIKATGGVAGTGGIKGTGGVVGTGGAKGGAPGTGGSSSTGGSSGGGTVDCNTALPSGGTQHTGNTQGSAGSLSWSLWMNGSGGSITTYSTPAFSASWGPNSGDFLARIGLQWGNSGKAVSSLGTVTADFAETKSGSAGGYSYIGIYGWSVNPCVEWYIVDDAYGNLPFNPGGSMVGTASIDGGTYNIIQRNTTGTGGSRCGNGVSSWNQFYSMRTSKRSCGTISISDHWKAWADKNLTLGSVLEASILIEAGGGTGSIQFPVANVTAQ
jgi:endo-1,4-beta-xylanase